MKINVLGEWKDSKPNVNVLDVWKPVQVGWVNVAGVWEKFFTSAYTYHITANQTDFNLFNTIGTPDADVINVIIDEGVVINSSSSGTAAFNVGDAYDGKTIVITNHGTIKGKGGNGGGGGSSTGGNGGTGGAGGTALHIRTTNQAIIINMGTIAGGGGGGGGGGGSYINRRPRTPSGSPASSVLVMKVAGGRGGNGGDGGASGAGGSAGGWNHQKIYGVWTRGGTGGRGGNGGSNGASGGSGTQETNAIYGWASSGTFRIGRGGAGGRSGYSIDGVSHVIIQEPGTISGGQVN